MRKIIAAAFLSLDGVMQAPGGPNEDKAGEFEHGGWVAPHFDEALGSAMSPMFEKPFDLLLGRKTYDIFAAHWPRAESGDDAGIAKVFNATVKHVATRSTKPLTWNNSHSLGPDIVASLTKLKTEDGPDLLIQGSGDMIQTLLAANLIDEFKLLIFPVLLGKGKRLFGNGAVPAGLKLTGSKSYPTGVISATYVPDGEVKTGSFELPPEE